VSDFTKQEEANIRAALAYLRAQMGGLNPLAKTLKFNHSTVANAQRDRSPSPTMAFRVARAAGVTLDDVLTGKFPPAGTCPHCGHRKEDAATAAQ
jgi:hypothetical protein